MNRKQIFEIIQSHNYSSGLIIDDNREWKHQRKFERINKYITGDLHDFFDLAQDQALFNNMNHEYAMIFIGEIFHVLTISTVVNNIVAASSHLTDGGEVYIALNQEDVNFKKNLHRLGLIDGYAITQNLEYRDEDNKLWTMLVITKEQQKQITDLEVAISIGAEIVNYLNQGKKLNKLKKGYLMSHGKVASNLFKQVFTTSEEMVYLYFQSQIYQLNPKLDTIYLNNLADFVFAHKKALGQLSELNLLKQGSFTLALNNYQAKAIVPDQVYVAKCAEVIDRIWLECLKCKTASLMQAIKELNVTK